jgi:hypothetical protein
MAPRRIVLWLLLPLLTVAMTSGRSADFDCLAQDGAGGIWRLSSGRNEVELYHAGN